jgi:hypothetical protein
MTIRRLKPMLTLAVGLAVAVGGTLGLLSFSTCAVAQTVPESNVPAEAASEPVESGQAPISARAAGAASALSNEPSQPLEPLGAESVVTDQPVVPLAPLPRPEIVWRVENPFRLFSDPRLTEVHRKTWGELSDAERIEPILSAERRLMQVYRDGWAREMYASTCWRPDANRYGPCPDGGDYINPGSHRVHARLAGMEASPEVCTWMVTPILEPTRAASVLHPCAEVAELDIPYPGGAQVSVLAAASPVAETEIKVRDLFIVGLGDSFAAGEGNPDRPAEFSRTRDVSYGRAPDGSPLDGYPARLGDWKEIGDPTFLDAGPSWMSQACHRSLYSYQARVALQLAVEDPHRAVTFISFACAGAEVTSGLLLRYKGTEWAPDQPDKPQISAVARAQCGLTEAPETNYQNTYSLNGKLVDLENIVLATCPRGKGRKIDLLLLSIGGNDVGFARLVANTILASKSTLRSLSGWMGQVQTAAQLVEGLPTLELRYKALNRALHMHLQVPWTESDRIILTAYPVMSLLEDGADVCPNGKTGMNVFPEFELSSSKAIAGERAAAQLNTSMRNVAKAFSWSFVERHRSEFAGHGVCAGSEGGAINLGDETRVPRKIDGVWQPYNPGDYQAYATRQRWFRTPNDAFLTGNYHIASSVVKTVMRFQDWEYFQLVLASTYSGAFHPTSEGQAVIADATLARARQVLNKYAPAPKVPDRFLMGGR